MRERRTVAVLEFLLGGAMDGNAKATEVFARIRGTLGDIPDMDLIRLFAQLRRWRLVSFRESPVVGSAVGVRADG
ncbi:MAG: hypothetical protein U5K38_16490 [Woeseiaceae bacterium]|nr:hypothetical protein [Woeseiaceae bacterium]